jgi:predicted RNA binding protein YcfA (HicA-like mRNA interferase family)
MQYVPPKNRDVERLLQTYGFVLKDQRGSHKHYEHPSKGTKVTIVGAAGDEMKKGTLYKVLKTAGIRRPRGW